MIRLDQIYKTDDPNDQLTAGDIAGIESSATDHLEFLSAMLSQFKRVLHGNQGGNWHDDPATVHGGDASLYALYNRATLEGKLILSYRMQLNDVSVPSGQNYVLLSGTGKPDKPIAIANTTKGAVVAQLSGSVGAHSLDENSGSNALKPKNLVQVFDGTTGDPILSSGRRVYALLQVGSSATDGNAFADSGNDQGQLSFVRPNSTYDDLEACPVADIENKSIVYAFSWRDAMSDKPEDSFRGDIDSADPQAGVTVSLDSAYDGGTYMEIDGNDVDIRLADTKKWIFRKGAAGAILWEVIRDDTSGDKVHVGSDVDVFDNDAADSDFANGAAFDTAAQAINVGKTASGVIDSTSLEVRATTGNAKVAAPSADVQFQSTRETSIALDDATAGPISTLFGQSFSSIAAAIKYAGEKGGVDLAVKVYTASAHYGRDVNVPGASLDLTEYSIDMNIPSTVNAFVFLNGRLLYGGNSTTNNDVYAGDNPANGDLKFDFRRGIRNGDVVITLGFKE